MAPESVTQSSEREPLVLSILKNEDGYIRRAAAAALKRITRRHESRMNALLNDACEYVVLSKAHAAAEEACRIHIHSVHPDCDVYRCPSGLELDRAADEALEAVQRVIRRIEA